MEFNSQFVECEIDMFDIFMELFWYYVCYCSLNDIIQMFDLEKVNYWLLVNQYIGGIEYVILYFLYLCFFYKLMCDFGLVKCDEFFECLLC